MNSNMTFFLCTIFVICFFILMMMTGIPKQSKQRVIYYKDNECTIPAEAGDDIRCISGGAPKVPQSRFYIGGR